MNIESIKEIQRKIGTDDDGVWGALSRAACRKYLNSIRPDKGFPSRQELARSSTTIFGRHGVDGGYTPPQKTITLPFTVFYEGSPVQQLHPHAAVADSFLEAFANLATEFPSEGERQAAGISIYDGLYNPRLMRGSSSTWSMHAWAIAIDIDAEDNMLKMHWPTQASMPFGVIECFTRAGFWSLGGMEERDAMHFECTSGA